MSIKKSIFASVNRVLFHETQMVIIILISPLQYSSYCSMKRK